jgi:hypothetical protein
MEQRRAEARDEGGVLEAARAVRPYLAELVGPAAADLDVDIAALLNADLARGDALDNLYELLNADLATSAFLRAVLRDAPDYRPPAVQPSTLRGYQPLPGNADVVMHLGKYVCGRGDWTWYRLSSSAEVPPCPTHGAGLIKRVG